MKCWCKEVKNYVCSDCENKIAWSKLSLSEKADLLDYSEKLLNNSKVLPPLVGCVSIIPEEYLLQD